VPPLLVVVSGPPGSGKTTLGRRLARDLMFPFVSKDGIKERLFESLGWTDREWSRQLGRASVDLLFYVVEVELSAGRSLVVENAFWKENATEPSATPAASSRSTAGRPPRCWCGVSGTATTPTSAIPGKSTGPAMGSWRWRCGRIDMGLWISAVRC